MPVQHLARFGRHHALLGAQQQLLPHLAFERGHLLAQRWLRNVQQIGRLRHAADIDNLYEVPQSPEVQVRSSAPSVVARSPHAKAYAESKFHTYRCFLSRHIRVVLVFIRGPV